MIVFEMPSTTFLRSVLMIYMKKENIIYGIALIYISNRSNQTQNRPQKKSLILILSHEHRYTKLEHAFNFMIMISMEFNQKYSTQRYIQRSTF